MVSVQIRDDLAPEAAMERAISLIEESGPPYPEKVVEAANVLRASIRQLGYIAKARRAEVLSPQQAGLLADLREIIRKHEREAGVSDGDSE